MKRRKLLTILASMAILVLANPATVKADELPDGWDAGHPENGWYEYAGKQYWYENGVLQGTEGRGKEIYDPASDAWYWLDSIQNGAMAVSKDVYQPYTIYGEDEIGKWVRYDENGHMVKGWDENENGKYYFDPTTGAMTKGIATIDGVPRIFHYERGTMTEEGFMVADGKNYWVENGVRQGTEGRGKEIYDLNTNAWFWLDAVDNGAVAVSKDVYQESYAGAYADREDGTGKWVRYNDSGRMVKGWDYSDRFDGNIYYFDLETGAMAKGITTIDGVTYEFDCTTGILLSTSAEGGMEELTNGIDAEAFYNYLYDDENGAYCGKSHNAFVDGFTWLGQDNEINHRVDGHSMITIANGRYIAINYNEEEKYYSYRNHRNELVKFVYDAEGTERYFMEMYNYEDTPQSVKEAIARIDFSTEDGPRAFFFSEDGYKLWERMGMDGMIRYKKIN